MRKQIIIALAVYIIIAGLAIIHVFYIKRTSTEKFDNFYSSFINGRIKHIQELKTSEEIWIYGVNDSYIFSSYPGKTNNNNIFRFFAKKGDSLYKAPYSDTLYLIKNGKEYKYNFAYPLNWSKE